MIDVLTPREVIAAELALLTRVADFPAAPLGYGVDISCVSDISPRMDEVDAFTVEGLSQALIRRQDCPRGALPDDPDYGIDVRGACNVGMTAGDVRALQGRIRNELKKDDRVADALVVVTPSPTGGTLSISETITPVDARLGTFKLVLAASSAAVLLEEMTRL